MENIERRMEMRFRRRRRALLRRIGTALGVPSLRPAV